MVIGIIGAGASGMIAAITAAQNNQTQVLLFERQARVGRKLQATGNGRCNLSNIHASVHHYHGNDPEFAALALQRFSPQVTLQRFRELGLYTVTEPSGRVYPYSDQANSVVDVLRFGLERDNIRLLTGCEVTRARISGDGFAVETADGKYTCDKLIVACGGLAGTALGGTMSGYKLLRSFGHHVTRLRPALVQALSDWSGAASLKGVRANVHVAVLHQGRAFSESTGELQFTQNGLSGPVMFEVTRDVCLESGSWTARLDFLPHVEEEILLRDLQRRRSGGLSAQDLLTGILHNRLGRVLVQSAGISGNALIRDLTDAQLQDVCALVKGFELGITGTLGMDSAQVTAGGAVTEEFDPTTMESRLVPGLYACGEVVDIDGECGGFNLQWAWSSGMTAGAAAGGCV